MSVCLCDETAVDWRGGWSSVDVARCCSDAESANMGRAAAAAAAGGGILMLVV